MTTARRHHVVLSTAAIVLFVAATWLLATSWGAAGERTVTVFLISLIAVAGIGVYSGNSGILSFGHVAFMGIGAYAAALVTLPTRIKGATLPNLPDWLAGIEVSLPVALLVAMAVTAAVAAVIGLAIGRLEGAAATITTLGLLIIVHGVLIGWRDVTRGAQTLFGVPRATDVTLAAIVCAAALLAARWFRDSRPGLRLRAGRDDAVAARSVGIRIRRDRFLAWVLSACLMALSGALLAHFLGAFSPKKFYFTDTFLLLAMLILGGMYTVTGAVLGTVCITLVIEVLRRLEGGGTWLGMELPAVFGSTQIGIGLIILFTMFLKADGISGYREWEERLFRARSAGKAGGGVGADTLARTGERADTENVSPSDGDASDGTSGDPGARANRDTSGRPTDDSGTRMLHAEGVTMRFGGLTAIDDVSLTLAPGEIVGLIGPNGSGKTTLLNTLSGVLTPSEGRVRFGPRELTGQPAEVFAEAGIARTFQNIRLFDRLSARQNVLAAAIAKRSRSTADAEALTDRALVRLGLSPLADVEAGTLSYGDQRRVEIARALAFEPAVLFLDEPAAGMNEAETDALEATLQALSVDGGLAILLVDHDLGFITALCDRVTVLNEGRTIAEGTPAEIKRSSAVIEAYLGKRAAARATTDTPADPPALVDTSGPSTDASRPQEADDS